VLHDGQTGVDRALLRRARPQSLARNSTAWSTRFAWERGFSRPPCDLRQAHWTSCSSILATRTNARAARPTPTRFYSAELHPRWPRPAHRQRRRHRAPLWNLADGSSIVLRGHDDDVDHARLVARRSGFAVTSSVDGSLRGVAESRTPMRRSSSRARPDRPSSSSWAIARQVKDVDPRSRAGTSRPAKREQLVSWKQRTRRRLCRRRMASGLLALGPTWTMEAARPPMARRRSCLVGHKALISHVEWKSRQQDRVLGRRTNGTLRKWDPREPAPAPQLVVEGGRAGSVASRVAADKSPSRRRSATPRS